MIFSLFPVFQRIWEQNIERDLEQRAYLIRQKGELEGLPAWILRDAVEMAQQAGYPKADRSLIVFCLFLALGFGVCVELGVDKSWICFRKNWPIPPFFTAKPRPSNEHLCWVFISEATLETGPWLITLHDSMAEGVMKHAKGRDLREVVHENRARIAFLGGARVAGPVGLG